MPADGQCAFQSTTVSTGKDVGIGVAMRIGPCAGPFAEFGETTQLLTQLASGLIRRTIEDQVQLEELQIDFDPRRQRGRGTEGQAAENNPDHRFKRMAKVADASNVSLHDLRRSCLSN
jgi:hypothetical protein